MRAAVRGSPSRAVPVSPVQKALVTDSGITVTSIHATSFSFPGATDMNEKLSKKKKLNLDEVIIDEKITELDAESIEKVSGGLEHTVDNGNNVRDCNYTPVR
jgi:hypothetical protein